MKSYITKSTDQTKIIAAKLVKNIKGGVFALTGDLGSGKTTFTQGFAKSLGIKDKIISPTFVVIRQHKIPKRKDFLYHIDLYRLEEKEDLKNIGLDEMMKNPNNIILIEWADKALKLLPKNTIKINFEKIDTTTRKITVSNFQA